VGEKKRGHAGTVSDPGEPQDTLYGGIQLKNIPIVKYRSSQAINCLRVIGGGTGKDKVSEFVEDSDSITAIGYIEGEPYHNNTIRSVETAQSIGTAIIDAKKDPIEEIHVELAIYISDLEYGDWVRIVDTHSNLDTTKRIRKITRTYSVSGVDTMSIELGEKFDNYQNIIRDLTKGDVDPEPDMTVAGGSLRITANDPPNSFVRIDGGNWYGTDGVLYNFGNSLVTFWGGNPPYNATTVGNYFKALVQIRDNAESSTDITYKTSLTDVAHTGYSKDFAKAEIIRADAGCMPLGEIILKCSSESGAVSDVKAIDEGGSFIYRDARPIVGAVRSGYAEGRWQTTIDDTWMANTEYLLLNSVGPTVINNRGYMCVFPGTSGATEPVWGVVVGEMTMDNSVQWECMYVTLSPDSIEGVTDLDIRVRPAGNGVVYLG